MNNRKVFSIIRTILLDPERKPLFKIFSELKTLKKGRTVSSLKFYFTSLVYKKGAGNIDNYVDRDTYMDINLNYYQRDKPKHPILESKYFTFKALRESEIPTSSMLALIQSDDIKLTDANDKLVTNSIEEMMTEWLGQGNVFVKQVDSSQGKDVFKVSTLSSFYDIDLKPGKSYIVEKEVQQHHCLNEINPFCINSLRIFSVCRNNEIHILPRAYLRTGSGRSVVDNASAGGIFIPYTIRENKLDNIGFQDFKYGGHSYVKHPNTNFSFKDKPLPYPGKVISIIEKAASLFRDQEIIGWDVAYTPDGPIILEGNDTPDILSIQVAFKGLLSNPVLREIFDPYCNRTRND